VEPPDLDLGTTEGASSNRIKAIQNWQSLIDR